MSTLRGAHEVFAGMSNLETPYTLRYGFRNNVRYTLKLLPPTIPLLFHPKFQRLRTGRDLDAISQQKRQKCTCANEGRNITAVDS